MRVVIPSVNYADFLEVTLPAWQRILPAARFTVVTSNDDRATQRLVRSREDVDLACTDVWYHDGAKFDKARALDFAFGFTADPMPWTPRRGEWCLSLDADVFPFGAFALPSSNPLSRVRVLYGVHRYACPNQADFEAHRGGRLPLDQLELIRMWRGRRIADPAGLQGYFQLWRYEPGDTFGSYPTAARYDVEFGRRFDVRRYLTAPYVLHLGEHRRNWSGRVTPSWGGISQEMEPR